MITGRFSESVQGVRLSVPTGSYGAKPPLEVAQSDIEQRDAPELTPRLGGHGGRVGVVFWSSGGSVGLDKDERKSRFAG